MGEEVEEDWIEQFGELAKSSIGKASLGVFWVTPEGKFVYVNETVKNRLGYSEEELKEMYVWDVDPNYGKEMREERWQRLKEEKMMTFESEHKTKTGEVFPVEITSHYMEFDGDEYEFAFSKDISERKEAEEREEFLHSLLRHDLKNKANVVRGYLEKIKDFDFPEEAELYIEEALKTTVNERDLIEKVRNLRKLEDEDVREIEISQILDQVFNSFEKQASEKDIELEFDKVECKVRGSPLLEELFSNLIENSFQHSGCDRIRIMGEDDGEWCVVSVIDDGEGIPDGEKEKIFNREFKDGEESGSGLGLYLVKRIVDDYGGEIEVKDSENGGARFDVRLRKSENWNE